MTTGERIKLQRKKMNIQNQTSASLCISRMFLVYENQTYEFAFPAQQVWEFTSTHGKTVTNKKEILSQEMPFSIHGHGVQGAYFIAYLPETLKKELKKSCEFKIVIQTKNAKKSFNIVANNPGADLNEYGYFPVTAG